jgi:hypothetical protein
MARVSLSPLTPASGIFVVANPDRLPSTCRRCSATITPGRGDSYVISIVAVADPAPPAFTEDDLARDAGREIALLLKRLRGIDEQEALDQVYRREVFALCAACYARWIEDPTGRP